MTGEILSGSRTLLKKGSCVLIEGRDEYLFRATNERLSLQQIYLKK
jgi:hypothetical protein